MTYWGCRADHFKKLGESVPLLFENCVCKSVHVRGAIYLRSLILRWKTNSCYQCLIRRCRNQPSLHVLPTSTFCRKNSHSDSTIPHRSPYQLGCLPLWSDLLCVEWDVKPYTLTHSLVPTSLGVYLISEPRCIYYVTEAAVDEASGGHATVATSDDEADNYECEQPLDLSCRATTDVYQSPLSLVTSQHEYDRRLLELDLLPRHNCYDS